MNYKLMLRMLGRTLQVEALCLLLPLLVALWYHEDPRPFLYTIVPVALLGFALARIPSRDAFFSREGFTVVGLIWLAFSLFGALPFWFSGEFQSFADCLFEIVSGFTTSGGTVLADIEALPRGVLFWRSFASWIGGMGVLLFTLAFLPRVGGRTQVLVHAEVPGPIFSKLVPKTVQSSQILYIMYFVLTGAEILAFLLAGLPLYDAVVTTFACVCTGGFSGNQEMIRKYYPNFKPEYVARGGGMRHPGDGVRMALEAGADIEGNFAMEIAAPKIQGYGALNLILGKPYHMWLNRFGQRFANEGIVYNFALAANACSVRRQRYDRADPH